MGVDVKSSYVPTPRIVGLQLINIQTYTQPTFIPFSPERTVFRGPNDAGKSVISKALQLFGGVFDKEDYAILVNYNHDEGYEYLYLDNRTVLAAHITVRTEFRGTESEKRIGTVVFYLYNWQMSAVLKQWDKYDIEIAEYLGWVTIREDNFCVNFMDGKRNILINTNPVFNTRLTESVCRNYDIEQRIENIERASKEVKQTKIQVQQELDKLQDKLSHYALPVLILTENRDKLNNLLFALNVSYYTEDVVLDELRLLWLSRLRTKYLSVMATVGMRIFVQSLLELNCKVHEHQMTGKLLSRVHRLTALSEMKDIIRHQELHTALSDGRRKYFAITAEVSALMYIQDNIRIYLERSKVQEDVDKHTAKARTATTLDEQHRLCAVKTDVLNRVNNFIAGVQMLHELNAARRHECNKAANYLIRDYVFRSIELSDIISLSYQSAAACEIAILAAQLFEAQELSDKRKIVQDKKSAIPVCPYCHQIIPQGVDCVSIHTNEE